MSSLDAVRAHVKADWANHLYLAGKFVKPLAGETYDAVYPATEEVFHEVPRGRPGDVEAAVKAARDAWDGGNGAWANLSSAERAKAVDRAAYAGLLDYMRE